MKTWINDTLIPALIPLLVAGIFFVLLGLAFSVEPGFFPK
jgi:hypothetical protein